MEVDKNPQNLNELKIIFIVTTCSFWQIDLDDKIAFQSQINFLQKCTKI